MNRLVGMITGNPTLLLWLALGSFALGLASGAGGAWTVQGWRLDAMKTEFDGFVTTTKAQGEIAENLAKAKEAEHKREKEIADHEYRTAIAGLAADVKRLRDDRARGGYVPAAPAGSRSPGLACFDRTELEQALQRLDDEISGLIGEGDADAVGLNVARSCAAGIRSGTSLGNPANARP